MEVYIPYRHPIVSLVPYYFRRRQSACYRSSDFYLPLQTMQTIVKMKRSCTRTKKPMVIDLEADINEALVIDLEADITEALGIDVLLVHVFTKLSATSVGQCRCVCRLWHQALTDSRFINDLHLNSTTRRPLHICAAKDYDNKHFSYMIYRFIDAFQKYVRYEESKFKFELKGEEYKNVRISTTLVGSCNGLVCLNIITYDYRKRTVGLWNPLTRDYKIAPSTYLPEKYANSITNLSFAYDHHNDDYKILQITYQRDYTYQQVDVYSLRSDSWVSLDDSAPAGLNVRSFRYAICNGCIYMVVRSSLARADVSKIVTFCLKDNSFSWDIPMPPENLPSHEFDRNFFNLKNMGGQLTAFQLYYSYSDNAKIKLWRFGEETREWKTWMTISPMGYELGSSICDFMEPLCLNHDGQLVVVLCSYRNGAVTKLMLFDTQKLTSTVLGDYLPPGLTLYGTPYYLGQLIYIQSLISPRLFER